MADKKLNEVTKVTDMAYVPVIMADGSIGQIAKSDLASVVAGQIGINRSWFKYISVFDDANNALDSGSYIGNKKPLINTPLDEYSILLTFNAGSTYIMQILVSVESWRYYMRTSSTNGESWNNWKEISFV